MIIDGQQLWNALEVMISSEIHTPQEIRLIERIQGLIKKCEANIKSPEEVERVIKYFQQDQLMDVNQMERWCDIVALLIYLHPELGYKQNTWKGEDFKTKEENKNANT